MKKLYFQKGIFLIKIRCCKSKLKLLNQELDSYDSKTKNIEDKVSMNHLKDLEQSFYFIIDDILDNYRQSNPSANLLNWERAY